MFKIKNSSEFWSNIAPKIGEFFLHILFWGLLLYTFRNYSLIRPFCFQHPYKEDISLVNIIFLVYLNIYLFHKVLFKRNWKILFWISILVSLVSSGLLEWFMVKSDIERCMKHFTGRSHFFIFPITLRNAGILSFFILLRFYKDAIYKKKQLIKMFEIERLFLSSRITPHYFSNVIFSMQTLLKKSTKEEFEIQLSKLEQVIHYMLVDAVKKEVTIKEELIFYKNYIELEKLRYASEITFTQHIEITNYMINIPPLLFENLICNAFKFCPHDGTGFVTIYLTSSLSGELIFKISNNIAKDIVNRKDNGTGLTNLKNRLELYYKNKYSLETVITDNIFTATLKINM